MGPSRIEFLLDTDVLVNIRDVHGDSKTIWLAITNAIVAGRVKTIRHVWGELEDNFDDVAKKLRGYKKQFVLPDDITYTAGVVAEVRELNRHHSKLWRQFGGRNPADPMLIAVAKEEPAPEICTGR